VNILIKFLWVFHTNCGGRGRFVVSQPRIKGK
jgi:hypothetical protein